MTQRSAKKQTAIPNISFTTQVWKESGTYIAYAPELDVSSCGKTVPQARAHLREACRHGNVYINFYIYTDVVECGGDAFLGILRAKRRFGSCAGRGWI